MPKCNRCGKEAPTAMAYGVEVFVCCGFPLVNTEQSIRLAQHIEHSRVRNEALIKRYKEQITTLELRLADAELEARGNAFQDKLKRRLKHGEQTIAGLKRLLTQDQRRKVVAMVVVMLKELAHQHTVAENMASSLEGGRCPLPGQAATTYNVLSDALRYALDVSSKDISDVIELLEPVDIPPVAQRADLQGGGSPDARADEEPDAQREGSGCGDAAERDFDEFWHRSE